MVYLNMKTRTIKGERESTNNKSHGLIIILGCYSRVVLKLCNARLCNARLCNAFYMHYYLGHKYWPKAILLPWTIPYYALPHWVCSNTYTKKLQTQLFHGLVMKRVIPWNCLGIFHWLDTPIKKISSSWVRSHPKCIFIAFGHNLYREFI